jgi:hypothetical protein
LIFYAGVLYLREVAGIQKFKKLNLKQQKTQFFAPIEALKKSTF